MAPATRRGGSSQAGIVFLTVFLDVLGFSILFPLFPALLDHYVALEGRGSLIGELATRLERIGAADRHAVVTLFGGVLGSLYSLLQFVFAPIWGALSDRIGRRPTLLLTLAGTVAGYALWIVAGSFGWLVASRLLGGIMAGNISTASAVIADTTSERERAGGMGIVGMAIGLGFVLGPAIGGIASQWTVGGAGGWERGIALNPFSIPAVVATALATANLAWVALRLPETRAAGGVTARERGLGWNPFASLRELGVPGVPRTIAVYLLYLVAFAAMEFTLSFLAVDRFAFEPVDIAWMFVFVGLVIALVQGGLVRRFAPRFGEKRLVLVGLALLLPGFLAVGWTRSVAFLYVGLALLAFGSALAMPCLSALASLYAPSRRQGLVLGHLRSAGALARAVGPLVGGALYWRLGSAAPYGLGALFLLLPLGLALGLPAPGRSRDEVRRPA